MVYRLHPSVMRPNIYKQGFNLDNASCHFVVQKGKQTMFLQVIIFRREILNPEGDNFGSIWGSREKFGLEIEIWNSSG